MQTKDLVEILSKRDAVKCAAIIERASLNGYHDYKFMKVVGHPEYAECACPKMQLVEDLSVYPELNDIRMQVIDGVYDEKADEEDQEEMRMWLLDDNASDTLFKALGFKVPTKEEREQHHSKRLLN